MIRIPFSSATEPGETRRKTRPRGPVEDFPELSGDLDERIAALETNLTTHAEELTRNVVSRVDRIESRFHRALVSMGGDEEKLETENVIEFTSDQVSLHHLPTVAALEALNELNHTLRLTREHVDALSDTVTRMKRSSIR